MNDTTTRTDNEMPPGRIDHSVDRRWVDGSARQSISALIDKHPALCDQYTEVEIAQLIEDAQALPPVHVHSG